MKVFESAAGGPAACPTPAEPGVRCESIRSLSGHNLWLNGGKPWGPAALPPRSRAGPFPVGGAGSDPTGKINHDADLLICKPVKYGR